MAIPVVLAIGGADPAGADGLAADLRTCAAFGVHAAAAVTLVAVQNNGWAGAEALPPAAVRDQIRAVLGDLDVAAVKTGALGSAGTVRAVAGALAGCPAPVIADAALVAPGGRALADQETAAAWRSDLLAMAAVVTANMEEAALLTGTPRATTLGEMARQAEALVALGPAHAIVTGGHGQGETSTDILASRGRAPLEMRGERFDRRGLRGLSATLASAVAAHVAHGLPPADSIHLAKLFVSSAIGAAGRHATGRGPRPLPQMHRMWDRAAREDAERVDADG